MIVTVTMNAALDRTLTVPNFRSGQRHRASRGLTLAGGRGINVARALGAVVVGLAGPAPGVAGGELAGGPPGHATRRQFQTVLNVEGEPLRLGLDAEPYLVAPNQPEAEAIVGQEFGDEEDFALALDHLTELGARNVIITHEAGCFALLREERGRGRRVRPG